MGVLLAFPSGDPITDFENYDAEKERQLLMRPKCVICNRHIQDDYCYSIQGTAVCEACIKEFRVSLDE